MTTPSSREREKTDGQLSERCFPPFDAEQLTAIELPVRRVTLLEDRAQVQRSGRVALAAGRNRLLIRDVATVLQDVSLRGEIAGDGAASARMVDMRPRRAVRVRKPEKPEQARELEGELEALVDRFTEASEDRQRAEQRYGTVLDMVVKGVSEIPDDAAWGLVNHQVWHDTFETLCKRSRELLEQSLDRYHEQLDIGDEVGRLAAKRQAIDRRDIDFVAWIEIDIESDAAAEVDFAVDYVVPSALWRPLHSARLTKEGGLTIESRAAVWQKTGEDWRDVELSFSTARASLGTEPPLLSDDLLSAQRKSDRVVVEQRHVAIQTAGAGHDGSAPRADQAVELPGVDDGGDIQTLRATGRSDVPSDGRLNVIPLFELETSAERQLVCMPELEPKVFLKATGTNSSGRPLLAGPVELIRDNGFVGWTRLLFVAPQERLELSFGHDDGLRVYRTQKQESEADAVDHWTHNDTWVTLYLSNLEGSEKQVEVVERIPVSEIEHVRVSLNEEQCAPSRPQLDDDGICRWKVTIAPNSRTTLCLAYRVSTAPEVEGL